MLNARALDQIKITQNDRGTHRIESKYAHLTIHYSNRSDNPDTINPSRPRYVTNNRYSRGFWVSDLIEREIKRGQIPWHTHEDEKSLKDYFDREKIIVYERDPTPEELEI